MGSPNVRVEKIGGTSMTRFAECLDNIILRDPNDVYDRVITVSAYGGVTNALLEHKKTGAPGIYQKFADQTEYESALRDLKKQLCDINKNYVECGLDLDVADRFISERVDGTLEILKSMNQVLASGYVGRDTLLLASREILASIGELHSAFNSTNIVNNKGYHATFVDLSGWGDSRELTIDERIADSFKDIDTTKTICFATGYTKGSEGIMREFDRGYSEVTFSKIAVALKAKEAVIHKEFHLSSGDPNVIGADHVHPVCHTNFDVADQLADVGMEAIHPKASKPLELAGVPIRVKNAFEPEHEGTLISSDYICPEEKTEMIAGSDKVTCLEVHDSQVVGEVGADLRIMEVFRDHDVSYISKMTNANTIGIVLWEKDCTKALVDTLKRGFDLVTTQPAAIVCAIGSNIAKPGVLALAASALASSDINILAVSQTSRQTNMQFVVERQNFKGAQIALHRSLCE
jgi:aspartate kinase